MKRTLIPILAMVGLFVSAGVSRALTPTPTRTHTPTPTPTSNRTADLSLAKIASPSPARVGQDLTYTLTIHNSGPSIALNVSLTDSLPADVVFVSASFPPSGTCFQSGAGTVSCSLFVLISGASVQAVIVVKPTSVGSVTNSAVVYSSGHDPNLSDNTASVTTEVREPAITLFLRGNGAPVVLSLDSVAPTAVAARYRDSGALNSGLRNPWVEIGAWPALPALISGTFIGFEDLHGWLGLKNGDDQGTQFDLRAELWKNGVELVAAGETGCVRGLVRDPANAKEAAVPLHLFTPVDFDGVTDVLSLRVLARIGTGCSGPSHDSATGLRFYFDGVARPSGFALTPGLRFQ